MIKGKAGVTAYIAFDTERNAPAAPGSHKKDPCYIAANITYNSRHSDVQQTANNKFYI